MGTRGVIGWITQDGTLKASYNHFDSYPTCLGKQVQKHLFEAPGHWFSSEGITFVEEGAELTEDLWNLVRSAGQHDPNVSTGKDAYAFLRHQQGDFPATVKNKVALDGSDFPRDSLFCEWGYLLDERTKEVVILEGFNTRKSEQADYCKALPEKVQDRIDRSVGRGMNVYYGCKEVWRGTPMEFVALDMEAMEASEDEDA